MSKTKTPHKYLVAYKGEGHLVYGETSKHSTGSHLFAEPMTLHQAKRYVKREFLEDEGPIVIYKLVPVNINKEKKR